MNVLCQSWNISLSLTWKLRIKINFLLSPRFFRWLSILLVLCSKKFCSALLRKSSPLLLECNQNDQLNAAAIGLKQPVLGNKMDQPWETCSNWVWSSHCQVGSWADTKVLSYIQQATLAVYERKTVSFFHHRPGRPLLTAAWRKAAMTMMPESC